jgi:hypothetical protein
LKQHDRQLVLEQRVDDERHRYHSFSNSQPPLERRRAVLELYAAQTLKRASVRDRA